MMSSPADAHSRPTLQQAARPAKHMSMADAQPSDATGSIYISLDNYPPREDRRLINSPRSLEACKMEGIIPSELLYR